MDATATPCASGCHRAGGHSPDCGDTAKDCSCACHARSVYRLACDVHTTGDGCGPHDPDPECKGCDPWPATHGVLCDRCWRRLTTAVVLAPDAVIHLRASVAPGSAPDVAGGAIGHPKRKFAPPAPGNLSAIDAADLIHSLLASAVDTVCDALGYVGPLVRAPAWRTTASHGQPAGLRANATGVESAPYAAWLWAHLGEAAEHPWVVDFVSDRDMADGCVSFASAVHRAVHQFPMEDKASPLPEVFCPQCERRALVKTPPPAPGMPAMISCLTDGCPFTAVDTLEPAR